jgi:quinol monooxygenase YgiN
MELYIFARFHAKPGHESTVSKALTECIVPTRGEPGCLRGQVYRSIRDPRLFFVHSVWKDESAFELHATLPHTVRMLGIVEPLIDHPLDVSRTEPID